MLPVPSAPLADGDSFVVRGGENQTCRGASRRHPTNPSCTGESRPGPKWPANPPHSPLHPFLAVDAPAKPALQVPPCKAGMPLNSRTSTWAKSGEGRRGFAKSSCHFQAAQTKSFPKNNAARKEEGSCAAALGQQAGPHHRKDRQFFPPEFCKNPLQTPTELGPWSPWQPTRKVATQKCCPAQNGACLDPA